MKQFWPGYGTACPASMKAIRRIAVKAERTGKFNSPFRKALSISFFLRRLPTVFFPPKSDVADAQRLSGKGYLRQVIERLVLLMMFRNEPSEYYICALFLPERYARAGEFIDYRQQSFLNFFLNQNSTTILTEDKVRFAHLCSEKGLRTAPIIARLDLKSTPEMEMEIEDKLRPIATTEGVFFKPRFGLQGRGAGRLVCDQNGIWSLTYADGCSFQNRWPEIFKILIKDIQQELIFQPLLKCHRNLLKFNPNSTQSVRFITFRDNGQVRPLLARIRLGIDDSLVDASYSAIGVPIDLLTGKLLRGGQKVTAILPDSIETFGPDNLPLVGYEVPYFEKTQALAIAVHDAFPEIFSLGHDIFILDDGPIILETNHIWGNPQYAHKEGLGSFHAYINAIIEIANKDGL